LFYLASAQHFAIIVIYIYYGRPRIEKIVFHPRYSSSSTSSVGLNDLNINFEQT
jgi:hypothetical protein